jgi:YidC/Oxa1 family membrane protein insertase
MDAATIGVPQAGPEGTAGAAPAAGIATPAPGATATATAGTPAAERPAILAAGAITAQSEEEIVVDTPLITVRMTNKGARVTSWVLKKYRDGQDAPLDVVSPAAAKLGRQPLDFALDDAAADGALREALFQVDRSTEETGGGMTTVLTFRWSDGAGTAATKVLRLPVASYTAEIETAAEVGGRPVTPGIVWGAGFEQEQVEASASTGVGTRAVLSMGGKIEQRYQPVIKPDAPWGQEGGIAWAGLENKYFAAIFVPQGAATVRARAESLRLIEEGREHFHLLFTVLAPGATHQHLFVGPKDYDVLKASGLGLEGLLDFGFFGVIAKPLFYALKFVEGYLGNYGWAIVVLTIGIRLVFFPFMHRSQLKMRRVQEKMKSVQPKLKALKEHYQKLERKEAQKGGAGARAKVRQEMNEKTMRLYKEEGVNPFASMSGCLPLLAQMPILYGFYTILTIAIELRHAPFMLWVSDLSVKDPWFVTPLLMGATMLIQQMMTSSAIADPAQRRMMYLMPIMFTWFFINLPAGLVLYWLVNNLLGIVQQYFVNKEADRHQQVEVAA